MKQPGSTAPDPARHCHWLTGPEPQLLQQQEQGEEVEEPKEGGGRGAQESRDWLLLLPVTEQAGRAQARIMHPGQPQHPSRYTTVLTKRISML